VIPSVTVASAARADVQDTIELDGVVAPSETVTLVARVAGYLQSADFHDGERVHKGQLLFVIEPEPYRQQVKLSQARVDQANAEARRQQSMLRDNATSQASVENAISNLQQAEANLKLAEINLDYTQVRAPFDGVIGRRQVDVGNYVGASPGGTPLGTTLSLKPAYINFSINERDLLSLRQRIAASGAGAKPGVGVLKVRAALQGESEPSEEGVLDFIDNGVGSSTGSLQLRGTFPNDKLRLIPGLYAKVVIGTGQARSALLIPAEAVQVDQQGRFVFVVDGHDTIVRRNVQLGGTFGNRCEVTGGLDPDERVVIAGIGNVSPGQTVAPHEAAGPAAAPSPPIASR
jgi:RND family efflux transporter MFP subunit